MSDANGSRRTGLLALGTVGVVLVGALLVTPWSDDAGGDQTSATSGSEDEPAVDDTADEDTGGEDTGGDAPPDGESPSGAEATSPGPDLPTFVDQRALTECATSAADELASFPSSTDDLVPSTAAQVSELRDLPVEDPIDATFLTKDELRERVADELDEEYTDEQADLDRRLLSALGVLDPDVDLRALLTALQGEQVAGFYDPETDELVVVQTGNDGVGPTDKVTLAHEIQHALADQRFELELGDLPGGADAEQARLAVIEGDATLTMTLWSTRGLSIAEQLGLATNASVADAAAQLEEVPRFLVGGLTFPYEAGLNLACAAFLEGGWPAVDALYADPPETTAQVLDLGLWKEDVQAIDVAMPSAPEPTGWSPAYDDTFGRLDLQLLFEAPGDQRDAALEDAAEEAARWRGGRAVVWRPDDPEDQRDVVDIVLDGEDLCAPVAEWLDATWSSSAFTAAAAEGSAGRATASVDGREISLACVDTEVRMTVASPP